jgi:thiamine pyrophosphokinase
MPAKGAIGKTKLPRRQGSFFLKKAVIFANGELLEEGIVRAFIHPGDFLIAADGGHRHMLKLSLMPNLVIGDLDSLPNEEETHLALSGVEIKKFPQEKNETDLELALLEAIKRNFSKILIVAALGARLDQTLGNLSLLAAPFLEEVDVSLEDGLNTVWLLTTQRYPDGFWIEGNPGERVSLIAQHSMVKGILTSGLKYPLSNENLRPYETRGISNEMVEKKAKVRIKEGQLLVLYSRNLESRKRKENN